MNPDTARLPADGELSDEVHHEVGNVALLLDAALTLMNTGSVDGDVVGLLQESRRRLVELLD